MSRLLLLAALTLSLPVLAQTTRVEPGKLPIVVVSPSGTPAGATAALQATGNATASSTLAAIIAGSASSSVAAAQLQAAASSSAAALAVLVARTSTAILPTGMVTKEALACSPCVIGATSTLIFVANPQRGGFFLANEWTDPIFCNYGTSTASSVVHDFTLKPTSGVAAYDGGSWSGEQAPKIWQAALTCAGSSASSTLAAFAVQ